VQVGLPGELQRGVTPGRLQKQQQHQMDGDTTAAAGDQETAPGGGGGGGGGGSGTGLAYDPRMMAHVSPKEHPESPARISSIFALLCERGLVERCVRVPSRRAAPAELAAVHEPAHVSAVRSE
jgi:hypothetical protein